MVWLHEKGERKNQFVIGTHCIVYGIALASRTLPLKMKNSLNLAIEEVDYFRGRGLNSLIFKLLCMRTQFVHKALRFSTNVLWFFKRRTFNHLCKL